MSDLQFFVCPKNRGQITEVAYSQDDNVLIRRTYDSSDNTTVYEVAEDESDNGYDLWQEEPDIDDDEWHAMTVAEAKAYGIAVSYTVECVCEDGGCESWDYTERPTEDDITDQCEEWMRCGEWGNAGAEVCYTWALTGAVGDGEDEDVDDGSGVVVIEAGHASLIREACHGRHSAEWERCCGESPDDHDWTSEGEGGLTENPGVWSVGGTAIAIHDHCRVCGLHRKTLHRGSQKNPGEHDEVEYTMPESWCEDCQPEQCECDQ